MKARLRSILQRSGYRYIFIGGCVYLLELLVIVVAQRFGASSVMAIALSFWIGLFVSFLLQKLVTFSDKRLHHRVLLPQLLVYSLLVLFNFGFTLLMANLLSGVIPAVITRTLALAITTIWNFYLYKTRIFKTESNLVY